MSDYKVTINSSLLNSDDFKHVKKSIEEVSVIDHKENFRVNLIEYINDSSTNNDDMFFYDMLEFVNFLKPGSDAIAFTTPEKLIYMNAPNDHIGEKYRQWEFVYDHECLHQLWETFEVQAQIEKEDGKYDHQLLNVASDCVINDYLYFIRKKERPDNLITPEILEKEFGVHYDRKIDTQYTLYRKLEKAIQENEDLKDKAEQYGGGDGQEQQNQQGQQGQQGNNGGQGNQQSQDNGQGGKGDKKDGQQGQGGNQGGENGQKGDQQGQSGSQGGKGDKEGDQQGQSGSQGGEGDKEGDQQGQDGSQGGEGGQKGSQQGQGNKQQGNNSGREAGTETGGTPTESDQDIKELAKRAKAIIDRYKDKISGDLGAFIAKCKASKAMKDEGLATKTLGRGAQSWNEKMNGEITAYVKNRVFQKKREMETTYTRVKRGSGVVKFGQPITPGKRIKEQKLIINTAFYIDRSGSMGGSIDNAFDALYIIVESLKKQFGKDKVVEDVTSKIIAFDTEFYEIKFGKRCDALGGTMSLDELINGIREKTNDCMINVIITDAGFGGANESNIAKLLDDIDGILLFITNQQEPQIEAIAKRHKEKMTYIFADSDFKLSK